MKYAIIIPDGCADEPQESLGGKTPLAKRRSARNWTGPLWQGKKDGPIFARTS